MSLSNYNLQNIIFDTYHISSINKIIDNIDYNNIHKFYKIMSYLYNNDLVFIFDWKNWDEGIEKINNFQKYNFEKLDIITNLMLLTTLDRANRFIEGTVEYNTNNGLIGNILKGIKLHFSKYNNYFNSADIELAIRNGKEGLEKYKNIMENFHNTNICLDKNFQKKFNHFYRIRQRNSDFYNLYYNFLEDNKIKRDISFQEILIFFYDKLNRYEPSFSSKILATINPNMPIWDSFIINNLGFKNPKQTSKNRLNDTIYLYEKIRYFYQIALKSEKCIDMINLFELFEPNSGITDIKKLDFVIWQLR